MEMIKEFPERRQHIVILDGLRGVAALAVVIFHFMEWVFSDYNLNFIGHGFLAVDFFFCLSGFVIGYAYDHRIKTIGVIAFFKNRFIRLHPLVIFGAIIGLIGFVADPFSDQTKLYTSLQMAGLFLCTVLLIPMPVMEDRAFNLFGLNAPTWSLFWEYIFNMLYAFFLSRIRPKYLIMLMVIGTLSLLILSYTRGNLIGGWAGSNFGDGGIRIAYSFLAGLCVYRFKLVIPNQLGFLGLSLFLFLAFVIPGSSYNWLTEFLVVAIYFPLMVSLGAGSKVNPGSEKIGTFFGNMSYPLYMTHYAFIWVFGNYLITHKPGFGELTWIISAGTVLLVGFAYLVMIFFDLPVRKYLREKWFQK